MAPPPTWLSVFAPNVTELPVIVTPFRSSRPESTRIPPPPGEAVTAPPLIVRFSNSTVLVLGTPLVTWNAPLAPLTTSIVVEPAPAPSIVIAFAIGILVHRLIAYGLVLAGTITVSPVCA